MIGVLFPEGTTIFYTLPPSPDRLWGPWGKAAGSVKLTTHLRLVPPLRTRGAMPPLPHTSSRRGV